MNVLFFADGGAGVGLGHLRRCGALADAFVAKGWDCLFVAANPTLISWLKAHGHELAPAKPPKRGVLPEADYTCDFFVADSYPLENSELASKVRPHARLIAAFDDHMNRHEAADIIISTNARAPGLAWPRREEKTHLLGPRYHPLPSEYLPFATRGQNTEVRRVLITLGGTGRPDALDAILRVLGTEAPDVAIDVVLGPFAEARHDATPGIKWHRDPSSLKPLFLASDLTLSSSGQTLFELAATGTPTIAIGLAENQKENLDGMAEAGVVLSAGWAGSSDFEARLAAAWRRAQDFPLRQLLSENGQRLIDGQGGARIAEAFARLRAAQGIPQ